MQKERLREDMQFVKEQIDETLRAGSVNMGKAEACKAVVQIADMDYVRALAEGDNELQILELMVRIHKYEQQEGIDNTILYHVSCFDDLLEVYYKVLFYLQRIWFELEEIHQRELITYVNKRKLSPYVVYYILEHSRIVDKEQVWKQVMWLWENAGAGE